MHSDFSHWIIPERLLLGSCNYTRQNMIDQNIDVVICVAPDDEVHNSWNHFESFNSFRCFPISFRQPDTTSAINMEAAKNACIESIESIDCRVFLHCVEGFNRSAAVAVLVVEALFCISRKEAIEYVLARRHVDATKHLAMYDQCFKRVSRRNGTPCRIRNL